MNENWPFRDVRREQPLKDADFAAIRATVLERVARRPRRVAMRFALALAAILAIAALALGAYVRLQRESPAVTAQAAPPRPRPAAPVAPVPLTAPATIASAAEVRTAAPHRRHHRTVHRPAAVFARAASPADDTKPVITVHLQTSNPDIRIIWIQRSSR